MAQRLIFPFTRGMIIAGYKTAQYKASWGYPHYGIDVSSIQSGSGVRQKDNTIYASGIGEVVWCQYDTAKYGAKSLGWALAIRYEGCVGRDGAYRDLVMRYMHSATCHVKKGDIVRAGDPILEEGSVGTSSPHVHIEIDTDTRYPQYTPQVSAGHSGWVDPSRGATDSTLNPSLWLWQDEEHRQLAYDFGVKTWINAVDTDLPFIPTDAPAVESLKQQLLAAQRELAEKDKIIAEKDKIIVQMRSLAAQLAAL